MTERRLFLLQNCLGRVMQFGGGGGGEGGGGAAVFFFGHGFSGCRMCFSFGWINYDVHYEIVRIMQM